MPIYCSKTPRALVSACNFNAIGSDLGMRGVKARFASDDGMTLVEVVVASAVLFFIMTAVLSLVSRTTLMSLQAKQMNDVNNAINSYVEWARSLPFTALDSLEATQIATGDYTVTIVPSIVDSSTVDAPSESIKDIRLVVTALRGAETVQTVDTVVKIPDRDRNQDQSVRGGSSDPTIKWAASCPPNGAVLWSSGGLTYTRNSAYQIVPLSLSANVGAVSPRLVSEVYMQGEQSWDLQNVYGDKARWFDPTWSLSPAFAWDLNQQNVLGEKIVQDGLRSLHAYVLDTSGGMRYDIRQYLVDNYAPVSSPAPIQHDPAGSMGGVISWQGILDGTSPVYWYYLGIRQQPATSTTSMSVWPLWGMFLKGDILPHDAAGRAQYAHPSPQPMSRYAANVQGVSPRFLYGPWSGWVFYVARPKLTGDFYIHRADSNLKWWRVAPKLYASAPSFESTGTTYEWYENDVLLATTTVNSFIPPETWVYGDPDDFPFPVRSYRVAVTTKPLGFPNFENNPVVTKSSNVVTTVQNNTGIYLFTVGTW